jgi:ABC-type transport system substrate-binding protein
MSGRLVSRRDFMRIAALVSAGTVTAACAQPGATPAHPEAQQPAGAAPSGAATGSTKYSEAPQLAAQVKAGSLAPVEDRLPVDPMIITPWESTGQYGGTWSSGLLGRADTAWLSRTMGNDPLLRWAPDLASIIPNIASSWEVSDDGRTFVFHLRKGMKWSDGAPFGADNFVWWYEKALLNKELTPTITSWMRPGGEVGTVSKIDDATVQFTFPNPNGLFILRMGGGEPFVPSHYLQEFHPEFNKEGVEKMVADQKLESWMALYGDRNDRWNNADRPGLLAWKVTVPVGSGTQLVGERNPYYYKVDPEGHQLPYIDKVVYPIAESVDVLVMKALNGEIGMMDRHIATPANKSVFYDNQEKGGYHFFGIKYAFESPCVISLNLNHKDPGKKELYLKKEFRVALSHAINRQELIDTIYVGDGSPAQPSPVPESVHYHEQLEKQYLEYNPDLANKMLDDLGLERDANGMRLRLDGKPLFIDVEVISALEPWAEIMEMVLTYWRAIGVDGAVKTIDRALFYERKAAYDHDCMTWTGADGVAIVIDPRWYMPYSNESIYGVAWADWWNSDGANGEEPPEAAKEQQRLYREIEAEPDPEKQKALMRQILDIAAEQFWCIGTTRYYKAYGIVKNNFKNVPADGVWQWHICNAPAQTMPEQYYIEQ